MEGEITREDIEKNKWLAGLSYIWILFILYWLVDSKFVKFHAKQSLTIFIAEVFSRFQSLSYLSFQTTAHSRILWGCYFLFRG
jgi:hypothetical protein